ncbi:hypothetical protein J5X84_02295 [Streptosporangiaceae bacterium NEAU-GS5]|nr:hypothetical protein [Streptosporangiaceae bacterium NEAU-GS5]
MTINYLPPPSTDSPDPVTYLREAQLQLDEVLASYDPVGADSIQRAVVDTHLRLATACAQIAQAEALNRLAASAEEALDELLSMIRNGGLG